MAILLGLSDGDRHGYALMKEIERQTDGALKPGTGSLYAALQRLMDDGLIEESPELPAAPDWSDAETVFRKARSRVDDAVHGATRRAARWRRRFAPARGRRAWSASRDRRGPASRRSWTRS